MALHRDPGRRFDQALRAISTVTELPPQIVALRGRLAEFNGRVGTPMLDRLAAHVLDGDDTDPGLLWAASLAEAASSPATHNEVLSSVRRRVHAEIRTRYADHAIDVYNSIAAQFDAAATGFADAAAVVDPELAAEQIIDATDKHRKAWRAADNHAAELHRLLEPLHAAAVLAELSGTDPDLMLPLVADCEGLHRREVWQAWEIETREDIAVREAKAHLAFTTDSLPAVSRCGRWSALLRLGARLRAHPATAIADYPRPRPMQTRVENTPQGPRRSVFDPEDSPEIASANA